MSEKYKIGNTFTHVKVQIDEDMQITKTSSDRLKVIGVSEHFVCLNNNYFDKLTTSNTFRFCYSKPEEVSIGEHSSDFDVKLFGKFTVSIYSQMSIKRIENKINREFNKWLTEKVGIYATAKNIKIELEY